VLVASTDGVGTKVKIAAQAGRYENIGRDLANHCINDILAQGARPLFFLDYIASSKLVPEHVAAIVTSMAEACRDANMALLGGETAEMPGVYRENEFDVAGTILGVVERENILPRKDVLRGDVLIGLASSGPHTNGYSLLRKVFAGVPLDTEFPEIGMPLADALLAPHVSYLEPLGPFLAQPSPLKALAHITGGGIIENLPRVLPDGVGAEIRLDAWTVPPLFQLVQERGEIPTQEMFRVFNMGIGMIAVVAREEAEAFQARLKVESYVIGELVDGERGASLIGKQ
jgi:phosphoribosylformylglycinamidine cyclo-ligase/phosphoribosylamine--glycine ligase/phosphoribosylformylglycinamidine cyclo-ligase